jgi:hypothetical protein
VLERKKNEAVPDGIEVVPMYVGDLENVSTLGCRSEFSSGNVGRSGRRLDRRLAWIANSNKIADFAGA